MKWYIVVLIVAAVVLVAVLLFSPRKPPSPPTACTKVVGRWVKRSVTPPDPDPLPSFTAAIVPTATSPDRLCGVIWTWADGTVTQGWVTRQDPNTIYMVYPGSPTAYKNTFINDRQMQEYAADGVTVTSYRDKVTA